MPKPLASIIQHWPTVRHRVAVVCLGSIVGLALLLGPSAGRAEPANGLGMFLGTEPVALSDKDLASIRAKGVVRPAPNAEAQTAVILWDEAGGGRSATTSYSLKSGSGNVQGGSLRTTAR